MGVRGLLSWLKPYAKTLRASELVAPPMRRIAIDISYYLYKWQGDKQRILAFLQTFQNAGHRILLTFDGRAADGKQWEAQRRRTVRDEAQNKATALFLELERNQELSDEQRRHIERQANEQQRLGWRLTKEIRNEVKHLLYEHKVPMLKAETEADGLLAALSVRSDVDVVISGDMDVFAMGARTQYVPIGDGTQFLVFERDPILQELGLTDYQFRSMCAMCFTEMREKEEYLDIRQAYQGMRVFRSYDALKKKHPEWLQVWPEDDHIFYHNMDTLTEWLREDQFPIYECFRDGKPMPYTD